MQIFTDTQFDFMGKRMIGFSLSFVLLVVTAVAIFTKGFNLGIDFRGGTELEFKFVETPDIADLRSRLGSADLGTVSLQTVGKVEENTILVRAEGGDEEQGGDLSRRIVGALFTPEEREALAAGSMNLCQAGSNEVASFLGRCPAGGEGADLAALAEEIVQMRTGQGGVLTSYADLDAVAGLTPELRSCIETGSFLPGFAQWKDYFVGPKVGEELRNKAYGAISGSLLFILLYIWWRFHVQYGIGAVLALFHDVIITTGLLVLLGEEFSLSVVAALLTLAGYSVNDTIVVYDRVRENLRIKRTLSLEDVVNLSVNQTLSRTVLTAVSTILVVLTMLLFGGPEFHGFSLALLIGVTLGTYSSIFVASPLVVVWRDYFAKGRTRRAGARA